MAGEQEIVAKESLSLLEIERNSEAGSGHDLDLVPWPEKLH